MAKRKTAFVCRNCGFDSPKWLGKCPSCGEWNTFVEEIISSGKKDSASPVSFPESKAMPVAEVPLDEGKRVLLPGKELNRVLGGGLVPGSIILVGGEPGIGKSTLMLQMALRLKGKKILYVSGEESNQQIRMRAERIGIENSDCLILNEIQTNKIFNHIQNEKPELIIIDSIQTLQTDRVENSPGTITQIRECAGELQQFAKKSMIPVFLVGHITKDGTLAGPKVLEHMVDTVLQFEGDRNHGYRILRSIKNRFGSTSELGIYEMQGNGLREVENPSEILISQRDEDLSGISIAATMEGLRPILIETQALVGASPYGTPQRSSTGFDLRRLNMLLAVLEKRVGLRLGNKDVFLNIAGGLRVDDPAIDLAVVSAVLSSDQDIPLDEGICLAAEVGLSGEIRAVNRIEQRILEAEKLGFKKMLIAANNTKSLDISRYNIDIKPMSTLNQVFRELFG